MSRQEWSSGDDGSVKAGANLFCAPQKDAEVPIKDIAADHAIHILHMHKKQARGVGKAPGLPPKIEMPEEAAVASQTWLDGPMGRRLKRAREEGD